MLRFNWSSLTLTRYLQHFRPMYSLSREWHVRVANAFWFWWFFIWFLLCFLSLFFSLVVIVAAAAAALLLRPLVALICLSLCAGSLLLDRGWMLDAFSWSCCFTFQCFLNFLEAKSKLKLKLTVKKATSSRRRHASRKLMRIHVPKSCKREKQPSDRKTTGLSDCHFEKSCKFKSIWQDSWRLFRKAKVLGRLGKPFVHLPQCLDQLDEARAFLGSTLRLC